MLWQNATHMLENSFLDIPVLTCCLYHKVNITQMLDGVTISDSVEHGFLLGLIHPLFLYLLIAPQSNLYFAIHQLLVGWIDKDDIKVGMAAGYYTNSCTHLTCANDTNLLNMINPRRKASGPHTKSRRLRP